MKDLINLWKRNVYLLIGDDLFSFYAFFTTLFAQTAFIWANKPVDFKKSLSFTILTIAYVVVIIGCAYFKGIYEGTKKEIVASTVYVVMIAILFVVGLIIDWKLALPYLFFSISLTLCYLFEWADNLREVLLAITFLIFAIAIFSIGIIPLWSKIVIVVLYAIFAPCFSIIEDETAACNIFEIAYDITYTELGDKK